MFLRDCIESRNNSLKNKSTKGDSCNKKTKCLKGQVVPDIHKILNPLLLV